MRIVVTGSNGFIGRNLMLRLAEAGHRDVIGVTRDLPAPTVRESLAAADFVFHLAGVSRPQHDEEFQAGNVETTRLVCAALAAGGRRAPVVLASSIQAGRDNAYGRSKRAAEAELETYASATGAPVIIFRLPNVFGKWARPNYNSVVATFCHQAANGLALTIHDRDAPLSLVYVDDVAAAFLGVLAEPGSGLQRREIAPVYDTTVGWVADAVAGFAESRAGNLAPAAGHGLMRALHATYVSALPAAAFAYALPVHTDHRGMFVEMLRTGDSGQFSYFTTRPGCTRGDHYHHTKTEKFLVLSGTARFCFRHVVSGERHEIVVRGGEARVVETMPGWVHNITNIGGDELIVMLWANEVFDKSNPDTVAQRVDP